MHTRHDDGSVTPPFPPCQRPDGKCPRPGRVRFITFPEGVDLDKHPRWSDGDGQGDTDDDRGEPSTDATDANS